jgi:formylglycine-generating enzyme required for sulfatase activity
MSTTTRVRTLLAIVAATLSFALAGEPAADLVPIPAAVYRPFYPVEGEGPHAVAAFRIQALPVRNADFLAFVQAHPAWRRDQVPPVFAGPGYLAHWADATTLGEARPDAPVTHVSWFAAAAYCDAQGLRLPSQDEWEVAARADATRADASDDPARRAEILARLTRIASPPGPVGRGRPTVHGVHDLHGLVWEWVEDPWTEIASGDSRDAGDPDLARVCGGASLGARDRADYPAFLRHAVRLGQSPSGVGASLGFRCAD